MVIVNRRRRPTELPALPSLTVEISRATDPLRPIHATVEQLTTETVVVTCESGVDALAVATAAELDLVFHGPGLEVSARARPGRRVEDVKGNRSVELVFAPAAREVRLTASVGLR